MCIKVGINKGIILRCTAYQISRYYNASIHPPMYVATAPFWTLASVKRRPYFSLTSYS